MKIKSNEVKIEDSWGEALASEFEQDYFAEIKQFLIREKQAGKKIYPPGSLIFNAFNSTPFEEVKVVILGQDPYHNPNEAMGLSFSVPQGVRVPPSLKRIYQEIQTDFPDFTIPNHGDLSAWAAQGVLLLNAMLTVEHKQAGSHRKIGWQTFTDAVIQTLSEKREGIVFLLWGNFAKKKASLIDTKKHHVLTAPHPSPLAGSGFFGHQHFVTTNQLLEQQGKKPINWQL